VAVASNMDPLIDAHPNSIPPDVIFWKHPRAMTAIRKVFEYSVVMFVHKNEVDV
jgi:hypothetical protein